MRMWKGYKIRAELRSTLVTLKSESKVRGMHKTSRIELRLAKMTVEGESKVDAMYQKQDWSLDGH